MKNLQFLSKKDIGARADQQDSVDIINNNDDILIALGDGMGGHTGGAKASNIFVTVAKDCFKNNTYKSPQELFEDIAYKSEEKISKYKQQSDEDPHTTLTLTLIRENYIHFSHIGDSRVYIFSRDGLDIRTRDHSVPEMLLQMGDITEDEIASHPDQNKLTKSLGSDSHQKPTYNKYKIEKNKEFIVLVCSDGFWEYVQEREMMYWINSFELEYALNQMIKIARLNGGENGDNISIAVVTNRIIHADTKKQDTLDVTTKINHIKKNKSSKLNTILKIILSMILIVLLAISFLLFSNEITIKLGKNDINITTIKIEKVRIKDDKM